MMQQDRNRNILSESLLFIVVIIWASNYPLAKYSIARLDIFVFNGIRYVVAAISLVIFFFARSRWTPIDRSDWPRLLRAGFVANVLYQVAFIVGLSLTTAGNSAVLLATAPLWTTFLNARIHKERIARLIWMGMICSLCGVVMIILGSGKGVEFSYGALGGDIICLAAAILWAFNTNLQKPLLSRYSASQLALIMITIGAVGLSAIALPSAISVEWETIHWTYYGAAIVSGILSIAISNVFWSYGVKKLGPGRTGNFGNLVPVLALIISYFTLNEGLLPIQFIGVAVTIAGVWIARQ